MPWLLLGFAAVAGFLYATYDRYPAFSKTANAQQLFNFPPFQIQQGKVNYILWLAPAGQSADAIKAGLLQLGIYSPENLHHVVKKRANVLIPGAVPAYADVWGSDGLITSASMVMTAQRILENANTIGLGGANYALPVDQQLTSILFLAATTGVGKDKAIIPFAARS